jgi:DNA polymerase (family 10)
MKHKQAPLFPVKPEGSDKLNILRGLDRDEVEPFASEIVSKIEPHCVRVEMAGSIRRRRAMVNDIDFVAQPKPNSWLKIIKTLRREFDAVTEKQGEKLATLYLPFASKQNQGYLQVDLYRASKRTWGILLLIRTGSKEYNIYLAKLAIHEGYRLAYSKGLLNEKGDVIASETEEDVFQALDLDYIPPEDRELKRE